MGRSVVACPCGEPLAERTASGRLDFRPGVVRSADPASPEGPALGLACPLCGAETVYLLLPRRGMRRTA